MNRDEVLETLRKHKQVLREMIRRDRPRPIRLLRPQPATPDSDVDILVRFGGPATSRSYFGTLFYIEDLLGRRIDLVTDKALRAEFRPFVEQEAWMCDSRGRQTRDWCL